MIFRGLILASVLLLSASSPSPCRARIDKKHVPDDFKVFARFYPGYSRLAAWKTTITAEDATQDVRPKNRAEWESKSLHPLTRQDLIDLVRKVKENDFSKLKERYDFRVTDNPTLVLIVTMDGQTTKVSVYAPGHLKDQEEVKRFLNVWSEVLKKVPSPNPEQAEE